LLFAVLLIIGSPDLRTPGRINRSRLNENNADQGITSLVAKLVDVDDWPIGRFPNYKDHALVADLINRGPAVVPTLLRFLDDPRPTKTGVTTECLGPDTRLRHWDEINTLHIYDGKNGPFELPTDLGKGNGHNGLETYRLTVGDVCFFLVGEIVNRDCNPLKYSHNGACVRSPIVNPAMAAAVRNDWASITVHSHKSHLLKDLHYSWRRVGAIARLWHYDRAVAEGAIVGLLSKDVYHEEDVAKLAKTVFHNWLKIGCGALDFLKSDPVTYCGVQAYLLDTSYSNHDPNKMIARAIIAKCFPDLSYDSPRNACSLSELQWVIDNLDDIQSPGITAAILALYNKTVCLPLAAADGRRFDGFVVSCIEYFRGQPIMTEEFQQYCTRRHAVATGEEDATRWAKRLAEFEKRR
jgi:hypothetical protein